MFEILTRESGEGDWRRQRWDLRFRLQSVLASGSMGVGRRAISASETREERKEPGEGL